MYPTNRVVVCKAGLLSFLGSGESGKEELFMPAPAGF
jgi:hypothetical protein